MFTKLEEIYQRPAPFSEYTADELWTNEHTSRQMLKYHLNEDIDLSSRNGQFIESSVKWMIDYFKIDKFMRVADFGCGPGLYTSRLGQVSEKVTGIDFSKNSLEYAREYAAQKQLGVEYVHSNYLNFKTEKCFDLIIQIMCDFCALSPAQRSILLQNMYDMLKPGGAVLLDVYSLYAFERCESKALCAENLLDGFWSPNKYYGFLNVFKYPQEQLALDKYTIVEAGRIRTVYNWLQYFSPDKLGKEFIARGFEIEALLGDVCGNPYNVNASEFALIARKPNFVSP